MKPLILAPSLLASPAMAQDNWHLLTKSQGGSVSILHGLSESACRFARNRLLGLPATPEEERAQAEYYQRLNPPCPDKMEKADWDAWRKLNPGATGCRTKDGGSWGWGTTSRSVSPSDILSAECFQ